MGKPRFPIFIDISNLRVIIFGGGKVAVRRVKSLMDFCDNITIISPNICEELAELPIRILNRSYSPGDCDGYGFVLAATDSREVNHAIFLEANKTGILLNVADAPDECNFYFPAIIRRDSVVIGVTASGTDHKLAKETAELLRESLKAIERNTSDAKT